MVKNRSGGPSGHVATRPSAFTQGTDSADRLNYAHGAGPPADSEGQAAPQGGSSQPFLADAHRRNSCPPRGSPAARDGPSRAAPRGAARRSRRWSAAPWGGEGTGGAGRRHRSPTCPPTPGGGEVSDEAAAGSGWRSLFAPHLPDALSRSLLLPPGSHPGWMLRSLLAPQPPPDSHEPWSRPQPPWTALRTPPSCSPPGAARPCLLGSSSNSRSSCGSGRAGSSARGRRTEVSASHGSLGAIPITSLLRPWVPPSRHPLINLPPTYPGLSLSEIFL